MKTILAFTLIVHFVKSAFENVYTHLKTNGGMIFKGNHNQKCKLIDLWKFKSLIDINYKFYTILVKWNLEEGINWYTYKNIE